MLSHTSPLSKKNEPDSDKSPVGARTDQLAAKIDNSLSNSQNIDEILKRNQHASTSVSVTSKNITTANYLNQNNQYITSQPIPSQNALLTLNNASSPQKTTLEELEKKLLELEKATQDPKSIFAQNPLITSTETLSLADQGRSPQKFGSHVQGTSEISQHSGQSYKKENSEKNKATPGKHIQFDAAQHGTEGELNIERANLKNKAARAGQLQNEEEGLEGADNAKQYATQKGIAIQSSSAQDLKNELKNNLSPSFGGQNARQHAQASHSNNLAEVYEGNNPSTGSADHQNIHYNQTKSQQHGLGSQDEGQEEAQFHQRPGAAQFDQLQAKGSAEKGYKRSQIQNEQIDFSGPSSDQADQGKRLENKNSQNKAIPDTLGFEKREASFGNNPSHHETHVRTIDLQDLMPSHGQEDSKSRQDNINPFSSQQEGGSRYENQYGENQGQGSSASKGTDLARFKQDVSEFLVTKKENPSGKNESELNRDKFQKSFENNLSVEQERKAEFSADKNIHFGTNETEERETNSGTKNPKSSLKKGASKNQKLSSEENEGEFNKESGESNQNRGSSLQSKKNVQYNSSEIEANNQRRTQKESSSEAVERKSGQKQQNMGKGPASEASQLKTPSKTDKAFKSDKKGTSNFPGQNQKTEESQAYSAGKVQKGINFGKQSAQSDKKNAVNRNEEEQQNYEGLYDSNSLFNNERGQNNRYSEKNGARRTDSSPEGQNERAEQRLSKMNEEQAANLYEQRRNDIQKNMQRISKQKGTTKLADKKQPKTGQNPVVSTVIPASEVRLQQPKLAGAEPRLSSQVKQPEERSQTQQSQELGGSKQKGISNKYGQGGKIEGSSQPEPKGRDSKNLWEKGSKTDTKQKRDYRQDEAKPDTVNKFGDAIQNARENILQRMQNIERALDKDDSSSARSDKRTSYSAEKDKSKIRPRDIRTAEGQASQDNRTPVGSGVKLKTPISAKTEISTATSPHDQQTVLTSNKIQGFSGYAAMKTQAKNIQKERQSYQPETVETQYEAPRAVSNSGVKNPRNAQNNLTQEKEKNAYSRPNATYETVNTAKGEINADSKFKRNPYAVNADVRTPSKKEETPKLFSSENKTRITANEFGNAQRDFSGSKQLARNLEGSKVSHSEIPTNSKYHEKRMKAQAEREESMLNNAVPGRNLERTNTNNTYSSEIPAHSKYHEKKMKAQMEREEQEQMVNQPQYKGQQKRKDKSLVQEDFDQRSPKRGNQTRENIKNRKEVSFSPRAQEYYSKPTGGDLSFEERNRLWVIKKNQNLAEKERMKYSQESIDCTFRPIIHQNENMKKLASDEFYQKNIEWSEKVRAENVLKGEMRLEEQQKPEPPKPRIRSNPTSPIVSLKPHGIFANKDLETIKKNLDFANIQSNKKLATYLEYDWNDDRLRKEIDDIEELYNYVKSLVKTRLDPNPTSPSKSFIADKPSSRPTIQQQNASPYSYKQKNPFGRTSLSAEKEVPRMQSLRNIVVSQNRDSHVASERASITKKPELEGTLHQEPGFNALMDKSASTRLLIKDNRYVIVDDNAPEAANEQF